jgi:hypothetical protein
MPFPFIPTALAVGFLLMWALIGAMLFRDGQIAARRERESHVFPMPSRRDYKKPRMRAAS